MSMLISVLLKTKEMSGQPVKNPLNWKTDPVFDSVVNG